MRKANYNLLVVKNQKNKKKTPAVKQDDSQVERKLDVVNDLNHNK